jgi:hypothetical protein
VRIIAPEEADAIPVEGGDAVVGDGHAVGACLLAMAQAPHLPVSLTQASRWRAAHQRQDGVAGVHQGGQERRPS